MSPTVPDVFDAALALGEHDRARLITRLIDSLDGEADIDAEQAWTAELERRLARIDAGEATSIPMDEAIERLRRAARGR